MSEKPIRHDYSQSPNHNTWRDVWAVKEFDFLAPGKAKMQAYGLKDLLLKIPLEENRFLPGEEVVLSMPDGDVLYRITKIEYRRNSYYLYSAELEYIQHLTGLRTVHDRCDKTKHARSIEWARHLNDGETKPDNPGEKPTPAIPLDPNRPPKSPAVVKAMEDTKKAVEEVGTLAKEAKRLGVPLHYLIPVN